MLRSVALFLVVVSLALAVGGGYLALVPQPKPSGLVLDDADRDVGNVPLGEREVTLRIANRSDRPAQVQWPAGNCGLNACIGLKQSSRLVVPPGETVELPLTLDVRSPGPFDLTGTLYLIDNELRIVPIRVRGVGVASGGEPHERKSP